MDYKFTKNDLEKLNDSLPSADAFAEKQTEFFGEGFRNALDQITIQLKAFGYTGTSLHRHGVVLGILLAQQQAEEEKMLGDF